MKKDENKRWSEYANRTKGGNPRPLLVEALDYVKEKTAALDLGSGALNDAKFLIESGFVMTTALDAIRAPEEIVESVPRERFAYVNETFREYAFPEDSFDLINAQYSLPFIQPADFANIFPKIEKALKPGGIFVGNFFGDRDEWSDNPEMTFLTKKEAKEVFVSWDLIKFEEVEEKKKTAKGCLKQWHLFNVITQKK